MAHKRGTNYRPSTSITLEEELMNRIDDYRFENRKNNRSQAIAELLQIAFRTLESETMERMPS